MLSKNLKQNLHEIHESLRDKSKGKEYSQERNYLKITKNSKT
jgi:hypothetical protein